MKNYLYFVSLVILGGFNSCDIKKSDLSPESSFTRVYESTNVDESYYPEDITQLESGQYLIISTLLDSVLTNYPRISITALAADGSVISSVIPAEFTNPVPHWLRMGGKQYFVCMDDISQRTKLVELSLNGTQLVYTEARELEQKLPLSAWSDGQNVLILSYDMIGYMSNITLYDGNLNSVWSVSKDASDPELVSGVYDHTHRYARVHYPFFIDAIRSGGRTTGYMVNCLTNSSLAMIFLDVAGAETGRVYSHHENGISSALSLGADTFAVSRFFEGENFVFPRAGLALNSIQNAKDFQDIELSVLEDNAAMDVMLYELQNTEYIVFASTTSNSEVVLLFFDAETGEQAHTRIIGQGNNIRVVRILETLDKGLAVLGETDFNGQFKRMILIKLTAEQLEFED